MKGLHTTVTRKGQITVPKEARDALGLRERDRVNVILREGRVDIERAGGVIAKTAGIFSGRSTSMTAEALRDAAEQAIVDDVTERIHRDSHAVPLSEHSDLAPLNLKATMG